MCRETTHRTYGAGASSPMSAIDMFASLEQKYPFWMLCSISLSFNRTLHDEPISYIELAFIINSFGRANGCLHLAVFLRYT